MKVHSIDIISMTWRDKVNGNSYSSGWIVLNWGHDEAFQALPIPFQYGGKQMIEQAAFTILKDKHGIEKHERTFKSPYGRLMLSDNQTPFYREIWLGRTTKKACRDFIAYPFTSYSFSANF